MVLEFLMYSVYYIISDSNLMYPIFITEEAQGKEEISSMPGIFRHSMPSMINEVKECMK
jgi:porphobilinogen synthase